MGRVSDENLLIRELLIVALGSTRTPLSTKELGVVLHEAGVLAWPRSHVTYQQLRALERCGEVVCDRSNRDDPNVYWRPSRPAAPGPVDLDAPLATQTPDASASVPTTTGNEEKAAPP